MILLELFCGVSFFCLIVALTIINGFWLITLDELELDHLNPADVTRKLNRLVIPELVAHGALLFVCLISWSPWVFLYNLPIAIWHGRRFFKNEHLLDPTEILKYKKLKSIRTEAIAKTIFYGLQIIYAMYWMVMAIISFVTGMKPTNKKRRRSSKAKAGKVPHNPIPKDGAAPNF